MNKKYPRGLRAKAGLFEDACDIYIIEENIRRTNMETKKFYSEISYTMPKDLAKILLEQRKGEEKKMNPQEFLCHYINEQYSLKGYCVSVIVE